MDVGRLGLLGAFGVSLLPASELGLTYKLDRVRTNKGDATPQAIGGCGIAPQLESVALDSRFNLCGVITTNCAPLEGGTIGGLLRPILRFYCWVYKLCPP